MEKRLSIGEATTDLGQARRSLRNFTELPLIDRARHDAKVYRWVSPRRRAHWRYLRLANRERAAPADAMARTALRHGRRSRDRRPKQAAHSLAPHRRATSFRVADVPQRSSCGETPVWIFWRSDESCVIVSLTADRAFVARCRSMPRKFWTLPHISGCDRTPTRRSSVRLLRFRCPDRSVLLGTPRITRPTARGRSVRVGFLGATWDDLGR